MNRRQALGGMAVAVLTSTQVAAQATSINDQIADHIIELHRLLAAREGVPLRLTIGADHPCVIEAMEGKSFRPFAGVPADLWRIGA
ncbi:hypothetical protein [Aureimonas ureilytica]|uniref:hypothetical protein n=1 Tax=Aureimonas ureilytica TaxID=401562 RepID=UPI000A45FA98|nr:hypothetical protein [Aureimonas ureilytica]